MFEFWAERTISLALNVEITGILLQVVDSAIMLTGSSPKGLIIRITLQSVNLGKTDLYSFAYVPSIMITHPCNVDPLASQFYIPGRCVVSLGKRHLLPKSTGNTQE